MDEDIFSKKRLMSLVFVILFTIVFAGAAALRCGYDWDGAFSLLFLSVAFLTVFIFRIEYDRVHGRLAGNSQSSLIRISTGYMIGCVIMSIFLFLPEYYRPMIVLIILMSALSNAELALYACIFWGMVLALTNPSDVMEFSMNLLMIVLGSMLCITLKEEKYRFYVCLFMLSLQMMVPMVFYYLRYREVTAVYLIYTGFTGGIAATISYLAYDSVYEETQYEVVHSYEKLIKENYPRVRELIKYSPVEYEHSRRVSEIAGICAEKIGIDSGLCRAAGFYYRMGRWVGKPYIENGVKRAGQLCFPLPLQQILGEFGGEQRTISTKESALVHMVDLVVLKSEVMEAQMGESQWNKNVLVSHTLNECSVQGLYDQSGMSINEFLKIRTVITEVLEVILEKKTEPSEEFQWEDE